MKSKSSGERRRRPTVRSKATVGPHYSPSEMKAIAKEIADRLFDRRYRFNVKRLGQVTSELERASGMPGWSHSSVMGQVIDVLKKQPNPKMRGDV
jgi:hypothetical protein